MKLIFLLIIYIKDSFADSIIVSNEDFSYAERRLKNDDDLNRHEMKQKFFCYFLLRKHSLDTTPHTHSVMKWKEK